MKLRNTFTNETRWLFFDNRHACYECGKNAGGSLEMHHITGRDSKSKLNASWLCKPCHNRVGHTNEEEEKYFFITFKYLHRERVKLDEEDLTFMEKHPYLLSERVKEFIFNTL